MKYYKAIFFDWDGTAVSGRNAPIDDIASLMRPLLDKGIYLIIVSGTTYEKIAGGILHEAFSLKQLKYLYLGLARGAYHFGFDETGKLRPLHNLEPNKDMLMRVHDTAYELHRILLSDFSYQTDIIFNRPNYAKIDLLSQSSRGDALFMQGGEIKQLHDRLNAAGFPDGLHGLIQAAKRIGQSHGITVSPTCDAKYLEIGPTTKSDNVDFIMKRVLNPAGIKAGDCCFWGDEFLELDFGIWGSDAFMITPLTKGGDFFDVSDTKGKRPDSVIQLGGGISRFTTFLKEAQ